MGKQQRTLMVFNPSNGERFTEPQDAWQWRKRHHRESWWFNPWTGQERDPQDTSSDPYGILIKPPGEPLYAADGTNSHMDPPELPTLAMNERGNPAPCRVCSECTNNCPAAGMRERIFDPLQELEDVLLAPMPEPTTFTGFGFTPEEVDAMVLRRLEFIYSELNALLIALRGPGRKK